MAIESITVEELTEQPCAVVRGRAAPDRIGELVGAAYAEVGAVLAAQGLTPAGPPFTRYAMGGDDGMDAGGQADEFVLAAGFPSSGEVVASGQVVPLTLPGGSAVTVVHVGAWSELGEAYGEGARWMAEHGLVGAGDPWETYLDGADVEVHRTVLRFPCRPA